MTLIRYLVAGTYLLALAAPATAFAQEMNLNGEWTTDCLAIGKNDRHGYITRITIRDKEVTATSQIYAKTRAKHRRCRSILRENLSTRSPMAILHGSNMPFHYDDTEHQGRCRPL